MFIPRGKIIHENLATSYVLVDALVTDLCEGGFSGVVEVVLRDADGFIIIAGGSLAAVIEKRGETYTRTNIAQLAEQSRLERGRVSVHAYAGATANAVVGRINGQTLYAGLSTEFTDLEKMLGKLAREREREWFVEINTDSGVRALMHMRDSRCRIISSTGDASEEESDSLDLVDNAALGKLVYECNRVGGTFDVYFKHAGEATELPVDQTHVEPAPASSLAEAGTTEDDARVESDASEELYPNELFIPDREDAQQVPAASTLPNPDSEAQFADSNTLRAAAAATRPHTIMPTEINPPHADIVLIPSSLDDHFGEGQELDLSFDSEELQVSDNDESMADSKRLMAEIARTIEEAAQAVGRPESFSLSLRAGQLKIADRYPFLDPFGGEFEYLAGEIVFVGQATAEEFKVGLTEALKLAAQTVLESTAYPDRFRAFVKEDLQKLLASNRAEFERFGLDQAIDEIIRF